jgi:pilus assembly protein CpaB
MLEAKRHIGVFLGAALLLSVLTAFVVYDRVQQVEAQLGDRVNVLVAAKDIPAQVPLSESDLSLVSIPHAFLQPGMVTDPKELDGKVSLVRLGKGDLIVSHALTKRVVIPDGQRVIRLYRTQVVSFDDNLLVGDQVDIVVTVPDAAGKGNLVTNLYLAKLPVVEVDAKGVWVGVLVPEAQATGIVGLQVTARQMQLLRVTPSK